MLSESEFKELAHLARLDGDDPSLKGLRDGFNQIVDFVEKINEIDTSGVEDFVAAHETRNVTRPDEGRPALEGRALAELAPAWEADHFVVPQVIDAE